jgi:hypothetical protein
MIVSSPPVDDFDVGSFGLISIVQTKLSVYALFIQVHENINMFLS